MKKTLSIITLAILSFCTTNSFACDACDQHTSAAFESLKKLVGTWETTSNMSGKDEKVKATYTLTSGDNALEEKIFVGTPHEMVSIYYPEGKTVKMTHYCSMGNRPVMTLKDSSDKKLFLEMKGHEGIDSKKEMHMHSIELVFNSDNQLTQNWTSFDKGKKAESVTFVWNRVEDKKATPAKPNESKPAK